jgi:hypothetical protein
MQRNPVSKNKTKPTTTPQRPKRSGALLAPWAAVGGVGWDGRGLSPLNWLRAGGGGLGGAMGRALSTATSPDSYPLYTPSSSGGGGTQHARPAHHHAPFPQLLQSTASFPLPTFAGVIRPGWGSRRVCQDKTRAPTDFRTQLALQTKKYESGGQWRGSKDPRSNWFRPLRTEHSLDPAIGSRDLSLVAVASRRVLAVTGSAQARNVTREKPKRGPRRQVVILGDSAPRVPFSCQQRCCSLIARSRLPWAGGCEAPRRSSAGEQGKLGPPRARGLQTSQHDPRRPGTHGGAAAGRLLPRLPEARTGIGHQDHAGNASVQQRGGARAAAAARPH